jgi:hypothetical protein
MREVSKGRPNLERESINPECSTDVGFGAHFRTEVGDYGTSDMKTTKARAPSTDDGRQDHFPIPQQDDAADENKGHNDKLEFKCDALASVNCNSQCLQD